MSPVLQAHIRLDERGVAWIDDTNFKVIEIALDHLAHGLSPDEICAEHYEKLSLAQVHAALSYYYNHQTGFDAEIARQVQEYEKLRSATLDSPGRRRLRSHGKLP